MAQEQVSDSIPIQTINAIIFEVIPGGYSALRDAKSALASAAASVTMRTTSDRTVIANNEGDTFLEKMESDVQGLKAEIEDFKAESEKQHAAISAEFQEIKAEQQKLGGRVSDLEKNISHAQKLSKLYDSVRERFLLTYFRDHVRGKKNKHKAIINHLNEVVVHGVQCVVDSEVIKKHPDGPYWYRKIYGVNPEVISNLDQDKHDSVIKVLDLVGGVHLKNMFLEEESDLTFQHIVDLLHERQYDAAQEECTGFLQKEAEKQRDAK
ncbi:hypothetical protein Plec18167_000472 [Paecilomyces lecythidis]|uniref:Uncharacterized protein n=1 Tax=Paecilomyces lecythidis TaxID=3004212 RepID=A0ABR3YE09_9EURO